jgi:hypothetical protein
MAGVRPAHRRDHRFRKSVVDLAREPLEDWRIGRLAVDIEFALAVAVELGLSRLRRPGAFATTKYRNIDDAWTYRRNLDRGKAAYF